MEQKSIGAIMKVGDLTEHYSEPRHWGIIVAIADHQYKVFWMDGELTWIPKRSMVKKKEVISENR